MTLTISSPAESWMRTSPADVPNSKSRLFGDHCGIDIQHITTVNRWLSSRQLFTTYYHMQLKVNLPGGTIPTQWQLMARVATGHQCFSHYAVHYGYRQSYDGWTDGWNPSMSRGKVPHVGFFTYSGTANWHLVAQQLGNWRPPYCSTEWTKDPVVVHLS